jgi:hypothetical protein
MKFSGPRMMLYHPWLALRHFWTKHFESQRVLSLFQNPNGANNIPE